MAALSAIASDITHIQHQLDRSSDQHSDNHQQLLRQLVLLLQEHAEARARDERMLAELAAAKKRDEEMHRMQQQTIDRLIVAQQRIEAIFVQNYELHEYPIPRLFVILPDSYEKWDPRSFLTERFRLYFLCECGEHCKPEVETTNNGQLTTATPSTTSTIPVKYSLHLAKHEGYELSRPTEFFDRYGLYVLGLLRVLKHCLAITTMVVPVVGLAEKSVKDVMDGLKTISDSTMQAVNMSIDFLENKLESDAVTDEDARCEASLQQDDDMFKDLAALEGADLRRLDTFLRKKDADKILGNLYRITTPEGHVKWVCLDHYRQIYRENAMASFIQSVEASGGNYDPHLGKVTISLTSSTKAKDFFSRLSQQAPAVNRLKVTFDWSFSSTDLEVLVDKVAQSNVQNLELGLEEESYLGSLAIVFRPGKGRYYSLLSLLSNNKIKGLTFGRIDFIGLVTMDLLSSNRPSLLQSFHYQAMIYSTDDTSLADIISFCPQLVDLRLGSATIVSSGIPKTDKVIGTLSKLKSLRRYRLCQEPLFTPDAEIKSAPYGSVGLKELIAFALPFPTGPHGLLENAVGLSAAELEVLVLRSNMEDQPLDLTHVSYLLSPAPTDSLSFAKLTHMELMVDMTPASLDLMAAILPRLSLVHVGINDKTRKLLSHVNLTFLKSFSLSGAPKESFDSFYQAVLESTDCQIESVMFLSPKWTQGLSNFLSATPLRHIFLDYIPDPGMDDFLRQVNLSQLQTFTIGQFSYIWRHEAILASRSREFADGFLLQLGYSKFGSKQDQHKRRSRDVKGSPTRLSSQRVRAALDFTLADEFYSRLFPSSTW
ncbi:hypothetical protein EC991_006469 [Linnemannia zychae]|nr:hypothetical protein EC991_006469 [Linnemannia zychae]